MDNCIESETYCRHFSAIVQNEKILSIYTTTIFLPRYNRTKVITQEITSIVHQDPR